ncbi:chemotaxis response regulator protein-glutamate methylesterase [Oceanobacillus jeddahense]|uniref:Protein-glutamate methylesterase/protein-glutamine glutaminase n=1 Tax=Oceanobacillus jeddahense TaxID=1462527 RepID=A0ABY5JRL7_9BACI|nr:chemotaxis response regulator protein-glutamate methylesterase [Oceanobacillus jeddahense]UUI01522.1 chemotaxis response regulator protein-glutamate methylesterase [Oceanobacillus jeddahense]
MALINVLVVDDSAFMRKMITEILTEDGRFHVAGTAVNGADGVNKVKKLHPDVVTMDVQMPKLDGLEALKQIMKECPAPVVMLSSETRKGADYTIQAISTGAVDFITKPSGAISLDIKKVEKEICDKVYTAATVKVHKKINGAEKHVPIEQIQQPLTLPEKPSLSSKKLIAIGTSTGGPRALQKVITALPKNLRVPVAVVQHMPPGFTASLSERLNQISQVAVKEAEHGELMKKGTVYIAPGGYHMEVKSSGMALIISLNQQPPDNGHRPSVNMLFRSLCALKNYQIVTCILTGMGNDGTLGLKELKKVNSHVLSLAETEETAIVYGMPKSIIKEGLADYQVPLNQMASQLSNLVN